MKRQIVVLIAACVLAATMALTLSACADESAAQAPDYSGEEGWYRIPEIAKDVNEAYACFCNSIKEKVAKRVAACKAAMQDESKLTISPRVRSGRHF